MYVHKFKRTHIQYIMTTIESRFRPLISLTIYKLSPQHQVRTTTLSMLMHHCPVQWVLASSLCCLLLAFPEEREEISADDEAPLDI